MTTKVTSLVLANTAVSPGNYGGLTQIPSLNIDAQGRVTFAANNAVAAITGTANQVIVTNGSSLITLSTPQNLGTTSNVQFRSIGIGSAPDTANNGSIVATGDIVAFYSDERLKTKLGNIDNALEKLLTLEGFYYKANEIAQKLGYSDKREIGVSAQQVQAILPEIVSPAPIDNQYLTVKYERLVPLLIEAIKELNQKIEKLEKSRS